MELNIQTMLYEKRNNSGNLRILGKDFCRNNKNKGKLIINNKKSELKELEYNYNNQISLLQKEKEVLSEKLNKVTSQIDEVKKNLDEEKNRI